MSEEHKQEILDVETILDSCVLAEGKRWYQVKWKPSWMTEQKLPSRVLETYKKEKVIHDENDGMFRISEDRKMEDGVVVEYLLCRGNTWESEEKLNSMDTNIVYSYWSHQSDLKEIVKIEEDFGDYESKDSGSDGVVETIHEESSLSDPETYRISMVLNDGDYEPVPYIKTEVDEDELCNDNANSVENIDNEPTMETEDTNDYQCAKCNSLFISGKMKDFLCSNEKPKGYTQCKKCGEMYCPRCSVNMGELRHNGKTSLFCDTCIENFANQSVVENHKVKNINRKPIKPNVSHVEGHKKTVLKGYPSENYSPKAFCCEICGKCFNRNSHVKEHEFIVTGENTFQCSDCFKKVNQQSHVNNQEIGANNMFQYFMPVVFQPVTMVDGNKQLNGFKKPAMQHMGDQGIKVLSGKHKSHVVHKEIHFEKNIHNVKNDGNEKLLMSHDKNTNDGSLNYIDEESIKDHQDDDDLDGKEQAPLGNYKCYDCGRSFNRQYTLDTHQRIHTGEKPYVCEICGARFRQSGTKLNHVRAVHTKERPFQCQYCGKTFSHKSSITVHIRIHTKEKPYQCKTCERCFTDRATYLKHQSIHSGLKPYSCPMCTRKFSQKSNLKRHYKNIHELGKTDTSIDIPSGSGDGVIITDLSNRPDLSAITAAMSEISSMPEYPPMPEYSSMSEISSIPDTHTKVVSENRIKVKPESTIKVMPENTIKVMPESAIKVRPESAIKVISETQSTVIEVVSVSSV